MPCHTTPTFGSCRLQLWHLDPNRRYRRVHSIQHHLWYVTTRPTASLSVSREDLLTPSFLAFLHRSSFISILLIDLPMCPQSAISCDIYSARNALAFHLLQSRGFNSTSTRSHVADVASTTGFTKRHRRRLPRRRPRRLLLAPSRSSMRSCISVSCTAQYIWASSCRHSIIRNTMQHPILVAKVLSPPMHLKDEATANIVKPVTAFLAQPGPYLTCLLYLKERNASKGSKDVLFDMFPMTQEAGSAHIGGKTT